MAKSDTQGLPATWLEEFVTRLSHPRTILALALFFVLLLAGAAYLDGVPELLREGDFLRKGMVGPVIFLYILLVTRLFSRSGDDAVDAFRTLVLMEEDEFNQLLSGSSSAYPRREWLALGAGAAFAVTMSAPWEWLHEITWIRLYSLTTYMLTFGLLGWIIYGSLAETGLLTILHRQPLDLDIFDPTPLEPVARQSLASSMAFIGGITVSLFLVPDREWLLSIQAVILYSILILVAVVVFFVTMNSTHQVMARTKEQELRAIRRNLSAAYRELKERAAEGRLQDMEALSDSITAWLAYEKRIEEAPEWPYTTNTLRNLVASTLVPIIAWAGQIAVDFLT